MPDVTSEQRAETPLSLKWVGMEEIAVPSSVELSNRSMQLVSTKVKVYVSLEKEDAKGIHMSRLHGLINNLTEFPVNRLTINTLLKQIIESQAGIGQRAKIELSFDLVLNKPALLSDKSGFQSYPIVIDAELSPEGMSTDVKLTIPYSSTCPCSASLARQLYADAVVKQFEGESSISKDDLLSWIQSSAGSVATPHSQRSYAYITLSLGQNDWPNIDDLIRVFEESIGTPVQTAVKREDEQEFARLNAQNLMFCEDAARKIKFTLQSMASVEAYWFKVEHQESLHAHNAVVIEYS